MKKILGETPKEIVNKKDYCRGAKIDDFEKPEAKETKETAKKSKISDFLKSLTSKSR